MPKHHLGTLLTMQISEYLVILNQEVWGRGGSGIYIFNDCPRKFSFKGSMHHPWITSEV